MRSNLRRIRTVLIAASVVALGAASASAPAQAKWKKLDCSPTSVRGAKICLYRGTKNKNRAQGRYINNSDLDLRTRGIFYRYGSDAHVRCAEAITEAHTTSRCTRVLATGDWFLGAYTWIRGESLGSVATRIFHFG